MTGYLATIQQHYETVWANAGTPVDTTPGLTVTLPDGFRLLAFTPTDRRRLWTYATVGMSREAGMEDLELHILSPRESRVPPRMLTAVAAFHLLDQRLDVGHTINFGCPWLDDSGCDHGLVSLPYLDGPTLEVLELPDGRVRRFLWLIPITKAERDFKVAHGLEALEQRFDEKPFDYADPYRPSLA